MAILVPFVLRDWVLERMITDGRREAARVLNLEVASRLPKRLPQSRVTLYVQENLANGKITN